MFFFGNGLQPLLMEDVLVISRKFEYMRYIPTMLYIVIYNPQIEMFARFKMKSSFHKTKRII